MEIERKKGKPGRPRKNKSIPFECYKGVVDEPENINALMEIKITEPFLFQKYLNTFKSMKCDVIIIRAEPDKFIIKSTIVEKKKEVNDTKNREKYIFIKIQGNEVYSYYCKQTIEIHISSIAKLENMIQDIDEGSNYITLYTEHSINNTLNFKIYDNSLKSTLKSFITTKNIIDPITIPVTISAVEDDKMPNLKISNYMSGDIKKMFGKKNKKQAGKCEMIAKNNKVEFNFLKDSNTSTTISFDLNENHRIINNCPNKLYSITFPREAISTFISHIKSEIVMIFFKKFILVRTNKEPISMKLIIPL